MSNDMQAQLDKYRQKVDVEHFDVTLRELVRMSKERELEIAPAFQRKFRWSAEAESKLIESIFLGLPVPSIFVASNRDGTWEVIDGLQRISTLIHFMAEDEGELVKVGKKGFLSLQGLEKLTEFNGNEFSELPNNHRLLFQKRSFRVTVLSDKSDYDVRFEMFERLNRGGVILSDQEVRSCIFRGEFIEFVEELASLDDFKALVKLQRKKVDDGTMEEQVIKFFAYLLYRDRFKGAVSAFLNEFCKEYHTKLPSGRNRIIFERSVEAALAATGGRPLLRKNVNTTPLNQLEAVLVGIGELVRKRKSIKKPRSGWQDDATLVKYSKAGTNTQAALKGRIDRAAELFEE